MPKLAVFLGNPGMQYKRTRHNTAWLFCDFLSGFQWQTKFHSQFCKDSNLVYLKPQTYMNESGLAVQEAAKFFSIKPQDILVVHDDIELPFGETRLQLGGGMGGHNGLRSVKQNLSTPEFMRLRIGIGRPVGKIQVADYVLGRFSPVEEAQLEDVFRKAQELFRQFGEKGEKA